MRLTSRAEKCAYSCQFDSRTVTDTGGFCRHKALNSGDLRPNAVRSRQGELALKTSQKLPISAK
jgi:hypothetical protein